MAERIDSQSIYKLLKQTVGINSIAPNEQQIGEFLEQELVERGFSVERHPIDDTGRANLLVQKGENPSILFYGHMDTVPVVNPIEWKTDPFKLEEIDGRFYGLGASDMKSGVAAFIEAATKSDTPVKIFLAVDEEAISEGAWRAVSEKREFFNGIEMTISAESSFNQGLSGIGNSRTGRSVYEVTFKGKPEHIIKYREAIDSAKNLSDFGYKLYQNREKMFKSPDTVAQIRKIYGESKGMSVMGEAGAEIEVLLGAADSTVDVQEALQKLTKDMVKLKPRKTPYLQGYRFDDFPYRELVKTVIKLNTGKEMTLHTRKSVGDDNVLATLKIPVLTWGPEGDNEHAPNEYVKFDSVVTLSRMYKQLLDSIGEMKQK